MDMKNTTVTCQVFDRHEIYGKIHMIICRLWTNEITGLSQSEEISSDLCCFYGGGISHNEDAFFS